MTVAKRRRSSSSTARFGVSLSVAAVLLGLTLLLVVDAKILEDGACPLVALLPFTSRCVPKER